ncbi:ferritin-like domain-containing protein [Rubripirellula lacrimiformis]|uniref:ferritin-like domain-containing protein n=1 Tax=Rubripirellula lacrimiformis TaxID=1930273 RepID=UPI001C54CA1B|nr:ferritin-like domain-containing protein [Rubripirellula lacrimiformis]
MTPVTHATEDLVVDGELTARDEAIFLLQTAAEIEQSLLVQYLYAAYSIDATAGPSPTEQAKAGGWRRAIVEIAIEEMAHLISMQNLLLLLGGPVNLEREDFPFRDLFYPFHFKLEPISLDSLAKYVVAEMPDIVADAPLQAIIDRATGAQGGMPINRVGSLFEKIDALLVTLTEDDIYPESATTFQATAIEWRGFSERIVRPVSSLSEARALANEIAEQGEGGDTAVTSHYQKFRTIYEELEATTTWNPSRPMPTNPNTSEQPHQDLDMEAGRITDAESRRWAHIADLQYRLLLHGIAHSLVLEQGTTARTTVIGWAFGMMQFPGLREVIGFLQTRPQHDPPQADTQGRERKAGPPFAMPYTLALPHSQSAQWRTYVEIVDAINNLLAQTTSVPPFQTNLEDFVNTIRESALEFSETVTPPQTPDDPSDPPPAPGDGTKAKADFLELLKSKQGIAQFMHSGVQIPAGGSLNELFSAENYDAIVSFLTSTNAKRPPAVGKPLVVPGSPSQSGFYIQITTGVMSGNFSDDEIQVVDRWIRSLAASGAVGGNAPAIVAAARPAAVARAGAVVPSAAGIVANRFATGLTQPLFVTFAPGKPDRLYIVEKTGAIQVLDASNGQLVQTFIQVDDLSTNGERGLLGLAFHPQYEDNGHFFVNCTDAVGRTTIRRYTASSGLADTNSRHNVMVVDQPFTNHNGGWIGFGPADGLLYIAMGDGGSSNDPMGNAQETNVLLGKMLRVDVDRDDLPAAADMNYGIPPTNPFAASGAGRAEIWSLGLRNPWRCSFDRLSADLWMGDVGQSAREELNFQNANSRGGENYGWRIREGTNLTGLDPDQPNLVDPIHEYGRSDGRSIVGGYVYRGEAIAGLQGTYFYADFLSNRIWSLRYDGSSVSNHVERTAELNANSAINSIVSFGEDAQGELYLVSIGGDIFRVQQV